MGNEWAMSVQYLSMHLEFNIKIALKCKYFNPIEMQIKTYILEDI
jgi:hypothetical protein